MKFKFEDLLIWKKSMDLGKDMNEPVYFSARNDVCNFSSQLSRILKSIALTILEDSKSKSDLECRKFLSYPVPLEIKLTTRIQT